MLCFVNNGLADNTELSVCWRYGPASGGKAILKSDEQIFSNKGGGKIPKCDQILGAVALSPPLPGDHVATLPEYGPLSVQAFKIWMVKFWRLVNVDNFLVDVWTKIAEFFFEIIAPPWPTVGARTLVLGS